ncbi:DNA-methyltransferase [Haloarcula rubripromontorii]|uniref:Type II methyltransferase n=1 Tax=Haloarcula rubripromontorii TaxID=1705562 RepID=A0A0M9AKB4_9EURY|nr:site-specific DNA-methyltransferase [Haloarcula rubripromontorii]KOX93752.1 modification methylase [Haloarcula rubripromontorii]NLV05650.1 site-specific DNA-methyltransferase [Haloarcula rubripromontorii]
METTHRVRTGDARTLDCPDDSVELVVTSPPYPMIEMWDDIFAELDSDIGAALDDGDGDRAFTLMHDVLDAVWAEIERVLVPGGIACINVGDATRSMEDGFRSFPNHAEITDRLTDHGLRALPDILWRKPTNSGAKFMGSGMVPPNAYPTLEHEHILVFRNGERRRLEPGADRRYESAYFWEERNEWFSDLWELPGETQDLDDGLRDRSGAFPLTVPYRLISMFSVYDDTVLDPFLGTGTTTLAAMLARRNSVGVDRDPDLLSALEKRVATAPERSRTIARERLADHRSWVEQRRADGKEPGYEAKQYDFAVNTKQEQRIQFYAVDAVTATDDGFRAVHEPVE